MAIKSTSRKVPVWFNTFNLAPLTDPTAGMLPPLVNPTAGSEWLSLSSTLSDSPTEASTVAAAVPTSPAAAPAMPVIDHGADLRAAAEGMPKTTDGTQPPPAGKWGLEDWNTLIKGVGTLGNLGLGIYSAINAGQMFDFQKNLANANLQNQATAYNTALEDKMRGRYSLEYYNANKDQIEKQIDERRAKAGG